MSDSHSESQIRDTNQENLTHADWKAALSEGTLQGQECEDCGFVTATPKRACIRCGGRDLTTVEVPTEGTVFSETTVSVAPDGFKSPYRIAIVELGDARLLVHIKEKVDIGDGVKFSRVECFQDHQAVIFSPIEPTDDSNQ